MEANGTNVVLNASTGSFTWFVNSTDFRLRFIVTDSSNNSVSIAPIVRLCNCLNGATCNASTTNPLVESLNNLLAYGECTCKPGFVGGLCETSVSYCSEEPCFAGVNCTDNIVNATADCDKCPTGYIGDGRKCYGE